MSQIFVTKNRDFKRAVCSIAVTACAKGLGNILNCVNCSLKCYHKNFWLIVSDHTWQNDWDLFCSVWKFQTFFVSFTIEIYNRKMKLWFWPVIVRSSTCIDYVNIPFTPPYKSSQIYMRPGVYWRPYMVEALYLAQLLQI